MVAGCSIKDSTPPSDSASVNTWTLLSARRTAAADFDAVACTQHHRKLVAESRWPCGVCLKVCPIGEDRKLYQRTHAADYLREAEALRSDRYDPCYSYLTHLRTHGSDGDGSV
jgi:hypothetical protein